MKALLKWLAAIVALIVVIVGAYWASEYYLVQRYAKHTIASNEHIPESGVKIIQVQLSGDRPWFQLFRQHTWNVIYQDSQSQALGLDNGSGMLLIVVEPNFGKFSSSAPPPA